MSLMIDSSEEVAMSTFLPYIRSSIGRKQIMAIVGLLLSCFLIVHLAGNLLLFKGAGTFNGYAKMLERNPMLIPAELALLAIFLVHLLAAATLIYGNWRARPVGYVVSYREARFWPSSLMIFTGITILIFLIVHLWTLKFDPRSKQNLYELVLVRFSDGLYTGFYVFCMIAVGIHLFHGFQSAFMTLGLDHPKYTPIIKGVGLLYAIAMAAGFIFIPVYLYYQGGMK